jgi:hypothetical protein
VLVSAAGVDATTAVWKTQTIATRDKENVIPH